MVRYFGVAALASLFSVVSAQTSTSCNPLTATCPSDTAMGATFSTDFTKSSTIPAGWKLTNTGSATYNSNGANLILAKQGDNPTLESTGYYLFGSLEVVAQAAPGTGIVTSIVMLSDDLDEVDWEVVGGNTAQIQSNYFGKGDTTSYDRAAWHAVSSPQTTFHTYKVDWTPSAVTWYIDGAVVRTLNYADAQSGARFPQTPMKVRIGIWAGGDPSNNEGTIEWAGGPTDYTKAPFTMLVKSVTVNNYSPGTSYTYGDNTGSYKSINIAGGSLMSSNGGSSASSSAAPTMTTALSVAKGIPTNPLTSVSVQVSANSTASATSTDKLLPGTSSTASGSKASGSGSGSSSSSSSSSSSASRVTSIGGLGAVVAIAMAMIA